MKEAHHDRWRPFDQSLRGDHADQLPETAENRSVPNKRDTALGEGGRRVLEDARAEKWRWDPDGSERRNFFETDGRLRGDEDGRGIRLFILAARDERDSAFVVRRAGIGVETGVQLRGSREREGAEESEEQPAGDEGSESCPTTHEHGTLREDAIGSKEFQAQCFRKSVGPYYGTPGGRGGRRAKL